MILTNDLKSPHTLNENGYNQVFIVTTLANCAYNSIVQLPDLCIGLVSGVEGDKLVKVVNLDLYKPPMKVLLLSEDTPVVLINIAAGVAMQYDPITTNVFADFLDDHDQPEAADLLRKMFPII